MGQTLSATVSFVQALLKQRNFTHRHTAITFCMPASRLRRGRSKYGEVTWPLLPVEVNVSAASLTSPLLSSAHPEGVRRSSRRARPHRCGPARRPTS